jgi:hypothetical protein
MENLVIATMPTCKKAENAQAIDAVVEKLARWLRLGSLGHNRGRIP